MTLVVVPCKSLDLGKSRLSPRLDNATRRSLCEFFLGRTLSLAAAAVSAGRVRLLTSDSCARDLAAGFNIETIHDEGSDLNSALTQARSALVRESNGGDVLILPTDLPCAELSSISRVVQQPGQVILVSNRQANGTNILRLNCEALSEFDFSYGPNSFLAHINAARSLGISPVILSDENLAFDIDDPEDYFLWQARRVLTRRQAAERLTAPVSHITQGLGLYT